MYILSGNKKEIVNSDFVERFCIVVHDDAALIVASYNYDRKPITMAKYTDEREAIGALSELIGALSSPQTCFAMPDSLLFAQERTKYDARTKRKGGS